MQQYGEETGCEEAKYTQDALNGMTMWELQCAWDAGARPPGHRWLREQETPLGSPMDGAPLSLNFSLGAATERF